MTGLFARGASVLAGLAAEPLRSALRAEAAGTVTAICASAFQQRGWPGVIHAGVAEWRNIAVAALRSRLGLRHAITAGRRAAGVAPGADDTRT